MGFSERQLRALKRNVDHRFVRTRESNGRELTYLEGWYAISQANRIFGFDGWNRETMESRCILARENRGSFHVVYVARVRITVNAEGTVISREGHGSGEVRGSSAGEAHDIAWKTAETDATKRALATFGKPFGLELYRNGKAAATTPYPAPAVPQVYGGHPDDTTPIPRPSRYSKSQSALTAGASKERVEPLSDPQTAEDTSIVPTQPVGRIDKSALTFSEPKRLRDKRHLRFVASHPCLVCGRQPADPHHVQFAQPRALGLKVSDEFTVPLCRSHHRQLHQAGNELSWWAIYKIDPLSIAKELWNESRGTQEQSIVTADIEKPRV